jgi:hypothetical protein
MATTSRRADDGATVLLGGQTATRAGETSQMPSAAAIGCLAERLRCRAGRDGSPDQANHRGWAGDGE